VTSRPTPPAPASADRDSGPGFAFYARLAGLIVAAGLVATVLMLIAFRAIYAWGILGGFVFFALLMLGVGWALDRRSGKGAAS
jgi:uncharacterized membrane protein YqjE